jgi:hypothetical protein
MLNLTAMYNRGTLTCDDMVSGDKRQWSYICILFPALAPGTPIVLNPEEPPQVPPPDLSGKTGDPAGSMIPPKPAGMAVAPEISQPGTLPFQPSAEVRTPAASSPLREWIADIGRTMALSWDFQEILHDHADRSGRYYSIAALIQFLLGTGIILLFGKYYSQRFDCIFSPLMGLSLLTILGAAAGLTGLLAARRCTAPGQKISPSWKICAAGLFMNYGTLACSFLALAHGIQHLWVQAVLVFIDTLVLCSSAMQLRDYMETGGRSWKVPVSAVVFFLNPVLVSVIYSFKTLI